MLFEIYTIFCLVNTLLMPIIKKTKKKVFLFVVFFTDGGCHIILKLSRILFEVL